MLSNLNYEQYQAVTAKRGYNLVIASAGTGKTSTIVSRIAYLIENKVYPEEILLLTFTNKAASEMKSRLVSYFGNKAKGVEAGTFHSISYKWLKKLNNKVTLKPIRDLRILFKSIYDKRRFDHISEIEPYGANYLFDIYSLFLNSNMNSFYDFLESKNEEQLDFIDIYEGIFEEYEQLKDEYNIVDFNSLLIKMIDSLEEGIDNPFKEVLVDEYQDTNPLQNRFIRAVENKSLFCVGDYDQSIYAFNGSDISIISSFANIYKNANVFTLKKNYRSYKEVIDLANKVISLNERIYPKYIEAVRGNSGIKPKLLYFDTSQNQYKKLAEIISKSSTKYDEIAVLFRNNSSADGVELYLKEKGIPTRRKGGISFFDSKEVKVILDFLTYLHNPKDIMSFIHIFEYAKGIGSAIANDIFEALMILGEGDSLKGFLNPDTKKRVFTKNKTSYQLGLFDDFMILGSVSKFTDMKFEENFLKNPILKHPKLTREGARFLYEFYLLLKELKRAKNPITIFDKFINSNLFEIIKENILENRSKDKNGKVDVDKYENNKIKFENKIKMLRNLVFNYSSLDTFINAMVLGSNEFTEGKGVNLLSVHASKGLEFKEVYIIDLMNGRFPNNKLAINAGGLEEERRLFYVAVTRAKDILYLCAAKMDMIKGIEYEPSIFLYEGGFLKKKSS